MKAEPTRRAMLSGSIGLASALTAPLALAGCSEPSIPGTLGGADWRRGHLLRDGHLPAPDGPVEDRGIVIAGGGVAGLAAAWRLKAAGYDDFTLFEMEDYVGGNARQGRNAVSAYPLGAHYLPVPNREARALRHMLEEFGMIVGEEDGAPVYDPFQLCADLEERLLWRGRWQEGLFPQGGISEEDLAQYRRFDEEMAVYRALLGSDGLHAFASPMAYSSQDPALLALDRISFADWLTHNGYTAGVLRAYLRYCCRDDYGSEPENVSAWAGLHYFSARRGWAARGDGSRELTWPEGNGRLVRLMGQRIAGHVVPAHSAFNLAVRDDGTADLAIHNHRTSRSRTVRARAVILAMPHFVAARTAPAVAARGGMTYAPWVVANVTVDRHPGGKGSPLAWDNVSTASDSLGYVVATHQNGSDPTGPTVLTWYLPLSRETPQAARKILMTRPLADWQRQIRADLLAMNPDLDGAIRAIDVWRWGHAMISPRPGFLSAPARLAAIASRPPVLFAHSDMSGLSLFEEAHHRGVVAAEAALAHLDHAFESLI
ncbi:FAD-dependent oxidoreductase [Novosphingobium colocasiae]|uniref:Amino oxidase n=1 Tax=Novosphingobium colocasiae TaxID=1256513 RepID=A0A918PIX2_9SPHN|nr:FAD-dependent oxidoreductase [Novosphingobium colocasiae]GGZ11517.1 amino oxidase [Novosphingobium colocasiae]